MTIIPAIDLQSGRCVRLFKGRFDEVTTYSDDPITLAQQYEAQGATWLHIVDLEGARIGQPQATDLIAQIKGATQLKMDTKTSRFLLKMSNDISLRLIKHGILTNY